MAKYGKPDDRHCPECNAPTKTNCRCNLYHSKCENGHQWHSCGIHNVVAPGGRDKNGNEIGSFNECSCNKKQANWYTNIRIAQNNISNPPDVEAIENLEKGLAQVQSSLAILSNKYPEHINQLWDKIERIKEEWSLKRRDIVKSPKYWQN